MLTLYSGGIPVAQLKMMLGLGAVGVALSPDGNGGSDITTKRKVPADFNGDGLSDILWQNDDGSAAIWRMNGASVIGGGVLAINPGPAWHIKGAGDYNRDGRADILWQNASSEVVVWEMNGTSLIGSASLGTPGLTWHV